MLDILRSKSRSVLTYILFGIIIVVFVISFGPGSQGCQVEGLSKTNAVEVDGYVVTSADFDQHYSQLFRAYQARVGQTFTRELADQLGLRNVAMNQLVDRVLATREARRRGLSVSDDDVNRVIWAIPSFQTEGHFDIELYKKTARAIYGSEQRFEQQLRDDLLYTKIMALLRESAQVSAEEVKEAWTSENDQVDLTFVRFPIAAAQKQVKVTDADVKAFLQASSARVSQFYKDNPARYEKGRRAKARHVLVRVPEGAPQAQDDAARKKVELAAERVRKGEDFGAVAKEISEDPGSKEKGGELGFFGPGVMAKPFEDAAFALKPGELSQPVRTRFGWHLIQVEAVEEAHTIPLAEVQADIAREMLVGEAARKLADQKAREALAQMKAGKKLADLFPAAPRDAAAAKKVAVQTFGGEPLVATDTGLFGKSGGAVPRVGDVPALATAAFAAKAAGQALPEVYPAASGPIVAQVKERTHPDPAKFAQQSEEVAARLRSTRQSQVEAAWLKALREGAKVKVNDALLRASPTAQD